MQTLEKLFTGKANIGFIPIYQRKFRVGFLENTENVFTKERGFTSMPVRGAEEYLRGVAVYVLFIKEFVSVIPGSSCCKR